MSSASDASFIAELKRRKVGRVAIAYVGVMMGVLEVSEYVLTVFGITETLYRALLIAAVAGFPVVLVLAWLFDLTSKGIELTPDAADAAGPDGLSARFARQLVVTGAIVILAMTGIGWRYMPSDTVRLEPNHIVVLPFENLSGDPGLEHFRTIAANEVIEGLSVMQAFTTESYNPGIEDQARRAAPEGTLVEAVGQFTNAGLVVTGSYRREADDLVFQVMVHDADRSEVVFAVDDARVNPTDPIADFELLRDRLFGYFGILGGRDEESADGSRRLVSRRAPSFAAYKEFELGIRAFSRGLGQQRVAAEHYDSAASIDSTFFAALWRASTMRMNLNQWAEVERLVERMEPMQSELTDTELSGLEWARGQVDGDIRQTHAAIVRGAELVPTSPIFYLAGIAANSMGRPEEAIEHFSKYDLKRRGNWPFIWTTFADARHRLGQHRRELWLLEEGRSWLPEWRPPQASGFIAAEFSALAALGRGAEIEERNGELGQVNHLLFVAEEVEAHGDPETAQRLFVRVLERLDAFTPEEQLMFARPLLRAEALAALGRDDEARALLVTFLEAAPRDTELQILSAILAARAGERGTAEETIDWLGALEIPYQRGRNVRQQARITAALGDAERAVRYLEAAFEQGSSSWGDLHVDPAYRDIRHHPAFVAFMGPRG